MTDLVLAGYAYSALVVTVASCVVIAGYSASAGSKTSRAAKGIANVIIVLSNTVITLMLVYGAVHT